MTKRIMRSFKLVEISAVDKPAQEGATMCIMKRAVVDDETKRTEGADMPEVTKQEFDDLQAKLAKAEKIAQLPADQFAYFKGLDAAGQDKFLDLSDEARKAEVDKFKAEEKAKAEKAKAEKAAAKSDVVYKALDGTEFTAKDDARLIALAKKADEQEKELAKAAREREDAILAKRVGEEIPALAGEEVVKVAVLRAIDTIADPEVRKAAVQLMKAANGAAALALEEKGASGTTSSTGDASKADSAAKLDALAKKYAQEHKVAYAKAYSAVLDTVEGKALYQKTL